MLFGPLQLSVVSCEDANATRGTPLTTDNGPLTTDNETSHRHRLPVGDALRLGVAQFQRVAGETAGERGGLVL